MHAITVSGLNPKSLKHNAKAGTDWCAERPPYASLHSKLGKASLFHSVASCFISGAVDWVRRHTRLLRSFVKDTTTSSRPIGQKLPATPTCVKAREMTRFRPCIDLHAGQVKQIVGGTLSTIAADLKTNYTSKKGADYYANLYREHGLEGAHVIMLGPGNEDAAKLALGAWPGGLQIGGGITDQNAQRWIEAGADKVRSSLSFVDSIRSIAIVRATSN